MSKYKLNILDRLVLVQVLGQIGGPGSYLYQKEMRKLRERVSFTEAQAEMCGLVKNPTTGAVTWAPEKAHFAEVEVDVGDRIKAEVAAKFKELDKNEQLLPEHLNTYEMFVGQEAEDKAEA